MPTNVTGHYTNRSTEENGKRVVAKMAVIRWHSPYDRDQDFVLAGFNNRSGQWTDLFTKDSVDEGQQDLVVEVMN